MATELEIRVTAELREIRAALGQLRGEFAKVNQSTNASAASGRQLAGSLQQSSIAANRAARSANGIQGAISSAVGQAKLLLGSLGAIGTGAYLVNLADTATRLRGQLTLVTKGTEELNRAQEATFAIAQRTRQGLEATVGLYQRIARTGRTTQLQTLALTETINQAVTLSFTSAGAAEAALFQLGQGLGSGVLRGEELNSILEQTPRLAKAIADGLVELGAIKDPGQLRKFAADGKLSAEIVSRAIQTQQKALRDEFAKLPPTVSDAFTALKNAFLKFIGDADSANGASRGLADAILLLANNLGVLVGALVTAAKVAAAWYITFRAVPALLGLVGTAFAALRAQALLATPAMVAFQRSVLGVTSTVTGARLAVVGFSLSMNGAALAAAGMATKLKAAGALAFAAFAGLQIGDYLRKEFQAVELFGIALAAGLTKVAFTIGHAFKTAGVVIVEGFTQAFNRVKENAATLLDTIASTYNALPGSLGGLVGGLASGASAQIRATIKDTEGVGAALKRLDAEGKAELARIELSYGQMADAAIKARETVEEGAGDAEAATGDLAEAIGGVVDQFALMKDAAERALAALDRQFEDGLISVRAYYAEKIRLQQASIDADLAAAQREAATATTTEQRSQALTQIIILERQRREVAILAARDQVKAEQALVDQLAEVQDKLLALNGDTAQARTGELERQYRDLLRRLDAESDEAGKALVRKLINVEAAKAQLDELKAEYSDATNALAQLEQTTSAQVSAGLLSNSTAEQRMADARAATIAQLVTQREAVAALYAQYRDPETLLHLQQLDQQIAQLSISTDDWRGKVQDAGISSLTTFFRELADGSTSAGDAVKNLAVNFTQALAAMAAQALAKKAISSIFDAFSGADADGGANQVANAAAAGLAYSAPVTAAATALGAAGAGIAAGGSVLATGATTIGAAATTIATAGGTILAGAAALAASAVALQTAAAALIVANSLGAGVAHQGGIAGNIAAVRQVSPYLFMGAPRYHTGGIAGLGPNEVPAVLQKGEEVLTRQDPRHRDNGGLSRDGGSSRTTTPVVAIGDRAVADALAGLAGEDVVITHVRNNWEKLAGGTR